MRGKKKVWTRAGLIFAGAGLFFFGLSAYGQSVRAGNDEEVLEQDYEEKLLAEGFPESYLPSLLQLHEDYPEWTFTPYLTGLTWDEVIEQESKVGLNLLPSSKSAEWKSTAEGAYDWTTDTYIPYDGSTWVTASEDAVKYYMDPRNFLDERGIFQFENLTYNPQVHTQDGVESILSNTPMYSKRFSYVNASGETKKMKYSKAFMKAAEESNVSPYHLASRSKQEVVVSATQMSSSVSGTVSGYEGIYNFYNIGATNSTASGGAVKNALKWASSGKTYKRPWTSPRKSIIGGAIYIGENYINVGQNTLYLQKFNVTDTNRYTHQYMSNIEAPNSEASKTYSAYGSDKSDMALSFLIPVYEDMPEEACGVPEAQKSSNNYLTKLKVKGYQFKTKFKAGDDGSTVYKLTVKNSVDSIKINATAASSLATVTGTGKKELAVGTNTFKVKVTAQDGQTRTYKVKVKRKG